MSGDRPIGPREIAEAQRELRRRAADDLEAKALRQVAAGQARKVEMKPQALRAPDPARQKQQNDMERRQKTLEKVMGRDPWSLQVWQALGMVQTIYVFLKSRFGMIGDMELDLAQIADYFSGEQAAQNAAGFNPIDASTKRPDGKTPVDVILTDVLARLGADEMDLLGRRRSAAKTAAEKWGGIPLPIPVLRQLQESQDGDEVPPFLPGTPFRMLYIISKDRAKRNEVLEYVARKHGEQAEAKVAWLGAGAGAGQYGQPQALGTYRNRATSWGEARKAFDALIARQPYTLLVIDELADLNLDGDGQEDHEIRGAMALGYLTRWTAENPATAVIIAGSTPPPHGFPAILLDPPEAGEGAETGRMAASAESAFREYAQKPVSELFDMFRKRAAAMVFDMPDEMAAAKASEDPAVAEDLLVSTSEPYASMIKHMASFLVSTDGVQHPGPEADSSPERSTVSPEKAEEYRQKAIAKAADRAAEPGNLFLDA